MQVKCQMLMLHLLPVLRKPHTTNQTNEQTNMPDKRQNIIATGNGDYNK